MALVVLKTVVLLSGIAFLSACGGTSVKTELDDVTDAKQFTTFQEGLDTVSDILLASQTTPATARVNLPTGSMAYNGVIFLQSTETDSVVGALNVTVGFKDDGFVKGSADSFLNFAGNAYKGSLQASGVQIVSVNDVRGRDPTGENAALLIELNGKLTASGQSDVIYDVVIDAQMRGNDGAYFDGTVAGQGTDAKTTFRVTGQATAER